MKKKEIENMLNGIDDKYLAEAIGSARVTVKPYRKIAAAVVLGLVLLGTGTSVLAATNSTFRNWICSFYVRETHSDLGKGIQVSEVKEKKDSYYLTLNHLPKGYQTKGNDTSCYYGADGDTDFFTVAYFHLQTDFTNILPMAKDLENYQTASGTVYFASSKYEHRAWLLFEQEGYMLELRDRNKVLSREEIRRIMEGATVSTEKPSVLYETLEWTEDLQESYTKFLAKYR